MNYRVRKPVFLRQHNTDLQISYGSHGFSDTRLDLEKNKMYDVDVEVRDWHTRYYIGDKYYNSVCFSDISTKDIKEIFNIKIGE